MIDVKFIRGNDSKMIDFPLKDGQLLVGLTEENTSKIYIDATVNSNLTRLPLGYCDSSYSDRIEFLENIIFDMNSSSRPTWGEIGNEDTEVTNQELLGFLDENNNRFVLKLNDGKEDFLLNISG